MAKTNIGWTNETWNPVTGCSHVSPGCEHCYAETLSLRRGWSQKPWTNQNAAENVVLHPDRLGQPLKWKSPRRVFVNSMSDLFHELIPFYFIADVFGVMQRASHHTFQVLTKRPARMLEFMQWMEAEDAAVGGNLRDEGDWPCPNVWLGVSVEDQRRADERIPLLLETPAAVRWISAEPLLGPLALSRWFGSLECPMADSDCLSDEDQCHDACEHNSIDWVVVGGESGPGRRSMNLDWLEEIAEQCDTQLVPFFVKQDSSQAPGAKGRIPDSLWARKEYPSLVAGR